jgi:hypothetical protein
MIKYNKYNKYNKSKKIQKNKKNKTKKNKYKKTKIYKKKGRGLFNFSKKSKDVVSLELSEKEERTKRKEKMDKKKDVFENAKIEALKKMDISPEISDKNTFIKCNRCLCETCNTIDSIFIKLKNSHENFYESISKINDKDTLEYYQPLICSSCNKNIDDSDGHAGIRTKIYFDSRKKLYKYILYNIKDDKRIKNNKNLNKISDSEYNNFYYIYSNDDYLEYILRVGFQYYYSDELCIDEYYHDAILNFYKYFKEFF